MAKGKGLYTYTVAEAQNIGLGQSGYKNVVHGEDTGTGEVNTEDFLINDWTMPGSIES